jgi:hypothetical protein
MNLISIKAAWNKFFFEERPTEGIALFRICWFSLIFAYYLLDIQNIEDFYGPYGMVSLETAEGQFPHPHANIFQFFKPSLEVAYAIMFLYGASLVTSILGFFTRTSMVIAFICMVSLHQRNIWLLSSSEMLMRQITLFLLFSPCGHALSIDSLLFNKVKDHTVWVWRLIQIQLSVVYVWTAWHKIQGDTWFDGSAVYYASRIESLRNFTIPYLMDSVTFLKLSTWGTLVVEFSLGTLIWVKELRKPVIIGGILFHLGIEYLMSIPFFELIMITLLINFISPEEIRAYVMKWRRPVISFG